LNEIIPHLKKLIVGLLSLFANLLRIALFFAAFLWISSCKHSNSVNNERETHVEYVLMPEFAKGYRVINEGGTIVLEITDPLNRERLLGRFNLTDEKSGNANSSDYMKAIEVPVKQFLALSSTQWGMLMLLGASQSIVGISEAPFVQDSGMRSMLDRGEVAEVARDGFFRYELLSTFPGAVMLYSPDAAGLPAPIGDLSLTPVPWPDFTEPHPLGRAEWIRLAGYLSGNQRIADSIFSAIKSEYLDLMQLAAKAEKRPKVFSDKMFAGQWYVPGGKSYIARIFEDAGAEYVFSNLDATGSIPLDPEAILARAIDAEFWRIPHAGDIGGYKGLLAENQAYGKFAAFRNHRVIYCNTRESAYFERGPIEPHKVLADFIAIFHPEILPDHKPRYHYLLK
jgi:iron complex transport system substrate-binding protein